MKNTGFFAFVSGAALGVAAVILYNSDKGKKVRKKVKKMVKAEKEKLVDLIDTLREEVIPAAEKKLKAVETKIKESEKPQG